MRVQTTTLAFLFSAGVLAACQGVSTYAPQAGDAGNSAPAAVSSLRLPAPFDTLASRTPDAAALCSARYVKVPGKYITMFALGEIKGTTFTSGGVLAIWSLDSYTKGAKPTPTPSTGPTATPTTGPTPKPVKVYLYTGTYMTKKTKQTGCALLIATVSKKPIIKGEPGNGLSSNSVQTNEKYPPKTTQILFGSLSETITGLSAKGGKGKAILMTQMGKQYDTATITLTSRIETKF
jgi:hypothetical protein